MRAKKTTIFFILNKGSTVDL